MSDHLDELHRQRQLLMERLAQLEAEIARAEATPEAGTPLPPAGAHSGADAGAEAILEQYRQQSGGIETRTKLGCVIYVVLFLGLLALAATAYYFHVRSARGH